MSGGRSVLSFIWKNFIKSLRPRQLKGTFIGEDYFGNKYYEKAPNPGIGKRRAERWFVPSGDKENFERELTAEWESWLRGRRVDPPTPEELQKNLTIMHMKKINAAKLDEKYSAGKVNVPQKVTGMSSFPVYEEYESGIGTRKQEEEREEAKEERENKK